MKLFTKEIDKKLFQQYPYGSDLESQKVVAKIFNPYGRGVWYIINSDPNDPDYLWAIVDLFEVEMGSVSRSELESIKVPPFGLHLERDSGFRPVNALELFQNVQQGKRYADGGISDVEVFEKDGKAYITPAGSDKNKPVVLFEDGGNLEMLKSQAIEFKHHADELSEVLKKNPEVHAWVVAKSERASSDLSDITHYLEGMTSKMANGGQLKMFGDGGNTNKVVYTHKYIPTKTLEILDATLSGIKGLQKDPKSLSKKERGEGIVVYYSDREMKELWQRKYEQGGNILAEDTVARVDDPAFADVGQYAGGGILSEKEKQSIDSEIAKAKNYVDYLSYDSILSILNEIKNENYYDKGWKNKSSDSKQNNTINLLKKLNIIYEVTDKRKPYKKRGYYLSNYSERCVYSDGGKIKQEWVAVYRKTEKPNEHKVIMSYGNSKDEAIRNAEMSRGYHKIGKDYELINIYTRSGNLPMAGDEVGMFANGGSLKDHYKEFDINKDGYLSATIDSSYYEIRYRDDVSQLYDLFKDGKLYKSSQNLRSLFTFPTKPKSTKRQVVRGYADDMPYEYAGGGGVSSLKMYEVEFTWKKKDEYDFDSRKVLIKAENIEQAQKLAKDKYGKYYEGFEIVEVEKEEDEKYAKGGGVAARGKSGNINDKVNKLYQKSGFINDDFNWKLKLLEMLQDSSFEAYEIYQSLTKDQKEEVLQEQYEIDNDMGSDGDGTLETTEENIRIMLKDAKKGKKYASGGATDFVNSGAGMFKDGGKIDVSVYNYGEYDRDEKIDYIDLPERELTKKELKEFYVRPEDKNKHFYTSDPNDGGGIKYAYATSKKYASGGGVGFDMFPFEHNGIRYNVIDTNGMINDRGQRLYKIDIEGYGSYNERAANIEIAKRNAIIDIDKIIEENGMFAGGGGVDSEIRGGVRYVKGKDLEWHDIRNYDIADYGEAEAKKMAYKYVQENIKYWNGELNENDFIVKKSRKGKDYKGSWVVMRQFPKYAGGGNVKKKILSTKR